MPTFVDLVHLVESTALTVAPVLAVIFVVSSILLLFVDADTLAAPAPAPAPSPSPRPGGATVVTLPVTPVAGEPDLDLHARPRAA